MSSLNDTTGNDGFDGTTPLAKCGPRLVTLKVSFSFRLSVNCHSAIHKSFELPVEMSSQIAIQPFSIKIKRQKMYTSHSAVLTQTQNANGIWGIQNTPLKSVLRTFAVCSLEVWFAPALVTVIVVIFNAPLSVNLIAGGPSSSSRRWKALADNCNTTDILFNMILGLISLVAKVPWVNDLHCEGAHTLSESEIFLWSLPLLNVIAKWIS